MITTNFNEAFVQDPSCFALVIKKEQAWCCEVWKKEQHLPIAMSESDFAKRFRWNLKTYPSKEWFLDKKTKS